MPSNPLINLLEQYNSDSDDEDGLQSNNKFKTDRLDRKVNDFLKEIQHIAPSSDESRSTDNAPVQNCSSYWQECFDESTGYPYYWHTQTNQVTWDLPKELEMARKENNQGVPQTSPEMQSYELPKSTFPSNMYKHFHDKIPEGMIPKEVVERSKSRYKERKRKIHKVEDQNRVKLNSSKESDSDDGRIEMITSFGSDGSESENDEMKTKPRTPPVNVNTVESNAIDKKKQQDVKIGPSLPQFHTKSSVHEHLKENGGDKSENLISNDESYQSQSNQSVDDQRIKFSLVPGYADDSDIEEDSVADKNRTKALFPITEFDDKNLMPVRKSKASNSSETNDSIHSSDDKKSSGKADENSAKTNKFLESSEVPTKAFQRKRRIAFDVRPKNDSKVSQFDGNGDRSGPLELIRGNDERFGLGFSKGSLFIETNEDTTNTNDSDKRSTESEKNESSSITFVRGEVLNLPPVIKEKSESEKVATKQEIEMILEKLKFLSEGSQAASAVQIMTIQLQTLLAAWETGDLRDRYLDNWLSETSRELCRLEKAAAPSGWNCQWDRSHKRYYYQNESTGETRWNYPDVIGGAEEMELCTTPPPTENDTEDVEGEKDTAEIALDDASKKDSEIPQEDMNFFKSAEKDDTSQEMIPPPPPQISSPSPPPPPRINAEDLKKGKKAKISIEKDKTGTEDKKIADNNVETSMAVPTLVPTEPLPPGVDSPEISFSITGGHPPIEPTVIFATAPQPVNPPSMYATATIQDPTSVSLIGHHHPALIQSQLVHYPAYHQHLHNQAILAAANRLTGQDTVQFLLDFPRIYTNTQVIAKPPVTTAKESLGSALNSFYNDIASLERPADEQQQQISSPQATTPVEPQSVTTPELTEKLSTVGINDVISKEKRKKKVKNIVSKKQKQVSSMVAKWQKAQNYEASD